MQPVKSPTYPTKFWHNAIALSRKNSFANMETCGINLFFTSGYASIALHKRAENYHIFYKVTFP